MRETITVSQELKPTDSKSPEHTLSLVTIFSGLREEEKSVGVEPQGPHDSPIFGYSPETAKVELGAQSAIPPGKNKGRDNFSLSGTQAY